MHLREYTIDARGMEWVPIFDGGDIHYGDVYCATGLLKEDLKWVKDNKAWWWDKGDKINATTPDDIRHKHSNVLEKYRDLNPADAIQAQKEDLGKLYRPIVGRFLGGIIGNHEEKLLQRHNINIHREFLQYISEDDKWAERGYHRLDLGQRAMLRIKFRVTKTLSRTWIVWLWHGYGTGGRERETRMRGLRKHADRFVGVNFFTMGHVHDRLFWADSSRITLPRRGPLELKDGIRYMAMSGTYQKGLKENVDGYADKMDFPACELRGLRLWVNPRTLEMKEDKEMIIKKDAA